MPSGISEHIEKVKPQIDALIESQGYVSKQKYELTTKLAKDLEQRIIELEKIYKVTIYLDSSLMSFSDKAAA